MAPRLQTSLPARGIRLRPQPQPRTDSDTAAIHDNAKRSVSIRINTSDYGRVKAAARRLRTREADIFRYLLHMGLARIGPLLSETVDRENYVILLASLGPDLRAHFGCGASDLASLVQPGAGQSWPLIDADDFELIDLAGSHPRLAQEQLRQLQGVEAGPRDLRADLLTYLRRKYLAAATAD
jgi:hypothetical protein